MSKKAFMSYIDSMLDLLLLNREKVEYFDKSEEIIFLGPDENTANLMVLYNLLKTNFLLGCSLLSCII